MSPIILLDNEYITLQYVPDKGYVYHVVHKPYPPDGQVLKDCLNAGAVALTQYGICKWLSDDRKTGPMSPALLEWGAKEFNPRVITAGWKYWANVVPEQIATAANMFTIIEGLHDTKLRVMFFTKLEDAIQWLDKQEC